MALEECIQLLKKHWGYDSFRKAQEPIVYAVASGHDTLAVLPTGGGKSICFQVPGLYLGGISLVVSPLIALMRDQVHNLKSRDIPAVSIDSGLSRREIEQVLNNAIEGAYKFIYLSPERLQNDMFVSFLPKLHITLLAIDEAHCISQWGHDFRPSYRKIAQIKEHLPDVPTIALTGSATPEVKEDILKQLEMKQPQVYQASFYRDNLSYSVFEEDDKQKKVIEIFNNVKGSGLVYVSTRKETVQVQEWLQQHHISSSYYHAGLSLEDRERRQKDWLSDKVRVMACTNAFGMGIDKPTVRAVVHTYLPTSLEAYFQEAGRAGRDGQKSYAVGIYNKRTVLQLRENVERMFPPVDYIKKVYQHAADYLQIPESETLSENHDFHLEEFCHIYQLKAAEVHAALKQLRLQELVHYEDDYFAPSKLYIPDHEALYKIQVAYKPIDFFVKTLLRLYGGELFSHYMPIQERNLARSSRLPESEVVALLQRLHDAGIWEYQPQKQGGQLAFLHRRYLVSNLPFNQTLYQERKARETQRIEKVIWYFEQCTKCRQQALALYFGEETDRECTVCDVCIQKRKIIEEAELEREILHKLGSEPDTPQSLELTFVGIKRRILPKVLQRLIDTEKVQLRPDGKLYARV